METLADHITRLRKELGQARATRDRIERNGQDGAFGGISFSQAAYNLVLQRVAQLERDLFNAESVQAGSDARADVRVLRTSTL